MIRPRLVLAATALATFGITAGAHAADLLGIPFAQSASVVRGTGFYMNLFKFVPVLAIYLLWAWTTYWVDDDTKELNNIRFEMWNSVVFFTGILGFILLWVVPIYIIGLLLLMLCYFVPLFTYVYIRNQTVPDDRKVLTLYHLGEVFNSVLNKVGMKGVFNRSETGVDKAGPPIHFIGKGQGGKIDNER